MTFFVYELSTLYSGFYFQLCVVPNGELEISEVLTFLSLFLKDNRRPTTRNTLGKIILYFEGDCRTFFKVKILS